MPRIRVFLSMGHPHSDVQSKCVDVLGSYLRECGIVPETLGQSFWSTEKPLMPIRQRMKREYGAVVLAMERFHSFGGVYEEGGQCERRESDQFFPSVWTHIETAMAYQLRLPLLILKDKKLVEEGIFDPTIHEWIIVPFEAENPERLREAPTRKYIDSWVQLVRKKYYSRIRPKHKEL